LNIVAEAPAVWLHATLKCKPESTSEPTVLLLDEPTARLTKADRTDIGALLTRLCNDYGICILLIEHDLDFVREISSRVVVFQPILRERDQSTSGGAFDEYH